MYTSVSHLSLEGVDLDLVGGCVEVDGELTGVSDPALGRTQPHLHLLGRTYARSVRCYMYEANEVQIGVLRF